MSIKRWRVLQHDDSAAAKFAEETGIPRLLAVLLQTRGIADGAAAEDFFSGEPALSDPFAMADMEKAVERINRAVDNFEKIAVYGDYDADGVTATAMLYSYLEACGADVTYYIPEREGEGYGLNMGAIDTLHGREVRLIVTVDNGISSVEEVAYAGSLGIDTVVTDHHRPREVLPGACAVVDPCRSDCRCPYRDFAGVGVAFKLIMALEGPDCDPAPLLDNYADLVAIGTIGDVVPLTGENRSLVKAGLALMRRTDRLGLRALMEQAGLDGAKLTSESVAFGVVPRINATGRIGSPDRAVRLLVSESPEEAGELVAEICGDNDCRRQIESEVYREALEKLEREPKLLLDRVLVVSGENWHHGVIGIVSSRLTERFGKPSVVISRTGDEAKGSGRSVEGFSLFEAVCSCSDLLTKFGGHPMAAGLSLPAENVAAFRERINRYAASLSGPMPVPVRAVDCLLEPRELTLEIPELARSMEPFGTGNPSPVFGLFGVTVSEITPVGGGGHLRVGVKKGNVTVRCMKFRTTLEEFCYRAGDTVDLAVSLEAREYNGRNTLSVVIRDMRPSGADEEEIISGLALYEKFRRGETLTEREALLLTPSRMDFASVYRTLRSERVFRGTPEALYCRLPDPAPAFGKLPVALGVLAEHGLIRLQKTMDTYDISLVQTQGKVDLFRSRILSGLNRFIKDGETDGMAAENL